MAQLRRACLILLLLGMPGAGVLARVDSLAELQLRSLTGPEVHDFQRYRGKPVLLMLFQPECNWCYKQVQALNQIQDACGSHVQPVGVGVRGSRRELREAIRGTRPEFPTYEASGDLLALLGREPATPTTLMVDASLQPSGSMLGYFPVEELRKKIAVDVCR